MREEEAVEPGLAGAVLARAGRVDPAERVLRQKALREVDRRVPRPHGAPPRRTRQRIRAGVTGRPFHGGGNRERRQLVRLGDHVDGAGDRGRRGERPAVAGEHDPRHRGFVVSRHGVSAPGRSGSR